MRVSAERLDRNPRDHICLEEQNEFPFGRDSLRSCTTVDLEKSFYYSFIVVRFILTNAIPL